MITSIAVAGAGTMGSGIAQVAAQSGYETILFDVNETVLAKAAQQIQYNLQYLVDKEKITTVEKDEIFKRILFTREINNCKAALVVEAIIENLDAKIALFKQLQSINDDTAIFASNTSSISITAIQAAIEAPQRMAGMHFFNPAPLMKLVEVIHGEQTSIETVQQLTDLCLRMNKTSVTCKDSPGFIVNRVARHYYLEAMRLVEQGIASIENVDAIMEATGFKMGPFKLMDLIGLDVNLAVSKSIYEAFNHAERFKPSILQEEKVAAGKLGKKTGEGFYDYSS